jgi:sugar lactone lactonase YvrE
VLARIDDATPDGLTVDAEGTIWLALWGGGAVRALSPEGRVLGEIATGAPLTTCCAFVGPHLDVLVVTSAGHDEPGLTQTDVAGLVLGVRPGVVGRATTLWEPVPLPG